MKIKYAGTKLLKEYADHLKSLPEEDKYTRFGYKATDASIDSYILSIVYAIDKNHLFVAVDDDGKIIGFTHLALGIGKAWELAVSVAAASQGAGVGNKLMGAALKWAKTKGIQSLFMHCISNNKKIQHLAAKHNLKVVERTGTDVTSHLDIPPSTTFEKIKDFVLKAFQS